MPDGYILSLGGLRVRWREPAGGEARVALEGDLDALSVPLVTRALDGLYQRSCYRIVVDLTDLAFIDSSGLGALVTAWRRCRDEGGSFNAVNPSSAVKRLLDLTGISRYLLPVG